MAAKIALRTSRPAVNERPPSHGRIGPCRTNREMPAIGTREEYSVRNSHRYSHQGGIALREGERGGRDYADNNDDGEQPQSSFKPCVHTARTPASPRRDYTRPGPAACGKFYSMNVVSCAPSSATNTAINSAGSVLLALADIRWVAPGGSKND